MLSFREWFSHSRLAVRTSLASAVRVDAHKECATFPADPLQQVQKYTKRGIDTFFTKHPPVESNRVEVFCKDSLCLITKLVRGFEMEVFASVCNVMMQSCNFDLRFLPVFRTLLFSCGSALQQFQLAMLRLQKLGAFDKTAIRQGCKSFQSEINPDGSTVNGNSVF